MEEKKITALRQKLIVLGIITFGGAFVLFLIGCPIQIQFIKQIARKNRIEARELIYDKLSHYGSGRRKSVYYSGLIDSDRVEVIYKEKYRYNIGHRIPVWYDPVSKNILYHRQQNEKKFNPFNYFVVQLKWFVFTMMPFILLLLLTLNTYKKYKMLKNELDSSN